MTATVDFVNRQSNYQYFLFLNYYYFLVDLIFLFLIFLLLLFFNSLLVHVDYVNYHVVIFMAHLHLNKLWLICDMWLDKIAYLLT